MDMIRGAVARFWRAAALAAAASLAACSPTDDNPTVATRYGGAWSDVDGDVAGTLARNAVHGCGEAYQRASTRDQDEYLVYCTGDGATWTAYLVWPKANRVLGPNAPDPTIPGPR